MARYYAGASAPPIAEAEVIGVAPAVGVAVAPGVAVARDGRSEAARVAGVAALGMPPALAEAVVRSAGDFGVRYWIIDNSGSMGTVDGRRVVESGRTVSCSRWEELGASVAFHAGIAAELGAPTEFHLLNDPSGRGARVVRVGARRNDAADGGAVRRLIASEPTGRTPLCAAIRSVAAAIAARADGLRAAGTRACVVVASDGEASDGDVAARAESQPYSGYGST